jgi:hypothetical protein
MINWTEEAGCSDNEREDQYYYTYPSNQDKGGKGGTARTRSEAQRQWELRKQEIESDDEIYDPEELAERQEMIDAQEHAAAHTRALLAQKGRKESARGGKGRGLVCFLFNPRPPEPPAPVRVRADLNP